MDHKQAILIAAATLHSAAASLDHFNPATGIPYPRNAQGHQIDEAGNLVHPHSDPRACVEKANELWGHVFDKFGDGIMTAEERQKLLEKQSGVRGQK
ncbi:MAG TPA: hypothetical protein VHA33_29235 [Candidatus Angelobacter sp.]|jgi:hypothetical protein|nr:hypothetical protein [Candidatus Angelobacter sp.]